MEIGKTRLQRQNSHQEERRSIHARHAAAAFGMQNGRIHNTPRQIGEGQSEQASYKQRYEGGAKSAPVGTQIPEQLQRLPQRFPIQFRFRKFDSFLIIA